MPVEVQAKDDLSTLTLVEVLEAAAAKILRGLSKSRCELDVSLVSLEDITLLNRDYRGKDRPTDVLSFPLLEDDRDDPRGEGQEVQLGDVVICTAVAAEQAQSGGWTLEEECVRLLLHGVLHLLGHDHEGGGEAEQAMKAEEARLVAALGEAGIPCAHDEAGSSND